MIMESVAVMKSPTMVFICTGYPNEIAWVDESSPTKDIDVHDWGEGRFTIEDHSLRCITPFPDKLTKELLEADPSSSDSPTTSDD
jgi:hypothetical protein